jgi:hypothetical protein
MKDSVFLQRARDDRAALIADLEKTKKLQRRTAWMMFGILVLNMTGAVFLNRRWVDYGSLLAGLMSATFAATSLYFDALIKTLKLGSE